MKRLFLLALVALALPLHAADLIPPELVGEWVSPDAKFDRRLLAKGSAVYVGTNGLAAVFGAPPPIGMTGKAAYDPKTFTLTMDLHDNGTPPQRVKVTIIYDPKTKTLTTKADGDVEKETFKRRQTKIPKWVIEETK